jgi:hypothetical protein
LRKDGKRGKLKRIRNSARFKTWQRTRARARLKSRRAHRKYLAGKRRAQLNIPASQRRQYAPHRVDAPAGYAIAIAPRIFSLIHNAEQTIGFIRQLTSLLESRRPVFVSLKEVSQIPHDGVVVLLSVMVQFKSAGIGFTGDMPREAGAAAVLRKSRFFSVLRKNVIESDFYEIGSGSAIHTHANRSVDAELSARIIERASKTLWGEARRCQGAQRVFVELMHNTNNHASEKGKGEKHWWVSVQHQPKKKRVVFSFVDFGIGVFQSLDNKAFDNKWHAWRSKAYTLISNLDNAGIFRLILQGVLHQSVTKNYYRGKGLPGIRDVVHRNGVSNLVMLTNDVYANVSEDSYRTLKLPFNGTFVQWELTPDNLSSPIYDTP